MTDSRSTALAAGAQESCARNPRAALPGMGEIAMQPHFMPVTRREVMAAVNTCSRELGLRPGAVVVLDALLSCLPCRGDAGREAEVTPLTLLTVYASNETLCFRARGITDRQLRRHLETLETLGLITRRDSANGKRFPIMRGGRAIGAFGLDLSPLFLRAQDLIAKAGQLRDAAQELRGLKSQILNLRAACLALPLEDTVSQFVESLRNLTRRATLTLTEARAVLNRLSEILATGAEPDKTSASDGQNVRHKEPHSETLQSPADWQDLTMVSSFYPEPKTQQETAKVVYDLGRLLRISQALIAEAAARLGLWRLLVIQDQMATRASDIAHPDGYLQAVLARTGSWTADITGLPSHRHGSAMHWQNS